MANCVDVNVRPQIAQEENAVNVILNLLRKPETTHDKAYTKSKDPPFAKSERRSTVEDDLRNFSELD